LEAALLVTERPLSARRLAQHAALADAAEVDALIEQLNWAYAHDGSPFRVELVATGYQLLTRPEFAPWLDRVHARHERLKLSPPALETLAIVAYRQPVTRADIEAVRGVQSGEMLKQLMERGLVRIAGEDESLGRPYLYGTTRQFLELFGLPELADLPHGEQLRPAEAARREFDESPDSSVAA
jgi:segregation and condensation protein B